MKLAESRHRRCRWVALAVGAATCMALRRLLRGRNRFDFRGRVIFITGGSRGLGLVLARQFAREGARIGICARDPDELGRAAADLESRGATVMAVVCDVTRQDDVDQAAQKITGQLGPIDVLVNNANIISVGPADEMSLGDYESAIKTHFWGPLYATLAVLPSMRRRKEGRIVNIASIGGKLAVPHLLPYSASKFALRGFSEGMRSEVACDGISVTTICPGLMRTGSPPNATFKGDHRAEYAWFSIGDSLPGLSLSAETAASKIIDACRYGDAELVLSVPAKIAVFAHDLSPQLYSAVTAWANRLLPHSQEGGREPHRGFQSTSAWSPSPLTALTETAAQQNNEI